MLKFFFKKSYSRHVEPEAFALRSSLMSYGCLSQIVWAPEKNTESYAVDFFLQWKARTTTHH